MNRILDKRGCALTTDEVNCHHALQEVGAQLRAQIIESGKGTMEEREWLISDILRLQHALQAALVDGGRAAMIQEQLKWREIAIYPPFNALLNGRLTRLPMQRERRDAIKVPPRGEKLKY